MLQLIMSYYPRQGFKVGADQLYHDADDILNTDCIRLESQQMNLMNGSENYFFVVLNHLLLYLEGLKLEDYKLIKHDEPTIAETNTISLLILSNMEFLNMEAINKIQISRTLKEVLRCLKFGRGDGRGDGIDPQFICSKEVLKERIERVVGYTNVFGLCVRLVRLG